MPTAQPLLSCAFGARSNASQLYRSIEAKTILGAKLHGLDRPIVFDLTCARGDVDRQRSARSGQLVSTKAGSIQSDRNQALRQQVVDLAYRHSLYGAGMIYLKLRQAGLEANH